MQRVRCLAAAGFIEGLRKRITKVQRVQRVVVAASPHDTMTPITPSYCHTMQAIPARVSTAPASWRSFSFSP